MAGSSCLVHRRCVGVSAVGTLSWPSPPFSQDVCGALQLLQKAPSCSEHRACACGLGQLQEVLLNMHVKISIFFLIS